MGKKIVYGSEKGWPPSVVIHTDGASRGNPGPASYGFVVYSQKDAEEAIFECAEALGIVTNNVAEYTAVVRALEAAAENKVKELVLRSDSELLIRQLLGEYRVKAENLQPLYFRCRELMQKLGHVRFEHVRRELNKKADQLANEVLDSF